MVANPKRRRTRKIFAAGALRWPLRALAMPLLLVPLLSFGVPTFGNSSSPSGRTSSASQEQRRHRRRVTRTTTPTATSSLEESLKPLASGRRACGLYLWDFPSALLHAWCTRLLKDCVYEGRGGKKFVRIPPGSVLQLLYPCHRFSPDRCLICGGSFPDHLSLWWSPHLYTPLDRLLDRTTREGVVVEAPPTDHSSRRMRTTTARQRRPSQLALSVASTARPPTLEFAFHRRYVRELEPEQLPPSLARRDNSVASNRTASAAPRKRYWTTTVACNALHSNRSARQRHPRRTTMTINAIPSIDEDSWEELSWSLILPGTGLGGGAETIVLLVPRLDKRAKPPRALVMARTLALTAVGGLLLPLQERETARARGANDNNCNYNHNNGGT